MSNLEHQTKEASILLKEIVEKIPGSYHFRIHACYHLVVPDHWKIVNRINDDYHLLFIKGGEGTYKVGDFSIPFEKGKVIFVSSGMLHSACKSAEHPPHIISIRFGVYDNVTSEPICFHKEPFGFAFLPNYVPEFQLLFEKLHRYYHGGNDPCNGVLCGTAISEILLNCYLKLTEEREGCEWDERVEKVKRILDKTPHKRFASDQLACLADLSEKYFRKIFKRQYGLTPVEYQTKVRMEYARFLLAESRQSIKNIAFTIGYPDLYSFSKQFKHTMGFSPSAMRMRK